MNSYRLRLASCVTLCFGLAAVLYFATHEGGTRALFSRFTAWAVLPYLFAFGAVVLPQARIIASSLLLGCGVVGLGGTFVYYEAFFVHPDAQAGLVFVFPPAYQLIVSLALLAFSFFCYFAFPPRNVTHKA